MAPDFPRAPPFRIVVIRTPYVTGESEFYEDFYSRVFQNPPWFHSEKFTKILDEMRSWPKEKKGSKSSALGVPPGQRPCDLELAATRLLRVDMCQTGLARLRPQRIRRHDRQRTCSRSRHKLRTWER